MAAPFRRVSPPPERSELLNYFLAHSLPEFRRAVHPAAGAAVGVGVLKTPAAREDIEREVLDNRVKMKAYKLQQAELLKKIAENESQLAASAIQIAATKSQLAAKEKLLAQAREKLAESKKQVAALEKTIAEILTRIAANKMQIADKEKKIAKNEEQIAAIRAANDKAAKLAETIQQRLSELDKKMSALNGQNDRFAQENPDDKNGMAAAAAVGVIRPVAKGSVGAEAGPLVGAVILVFQGQEIYKQAKALREVNELIAGGAAIDTEVGEIGKLQTELKETLDTLKDATKVDPLVDPQKDPHKKKTDKDANQDDDDEPCFAAGTLLLVPGGEKVIESFRPGDEILSRSEHDQEGAIEVSVVEEVFQRVARILHVHVAGQVIRTVADHPFWVHKGGWKPASELRIGDLLLSHDGRMMSVEGLLDTGEDETVYNLRVARCHTYFVGCDEWGFSVWVHNRCWYHGTDNESAADVVENGLDRAKWQKYVDEGGDGTGWSVTTDPKIAAAWAAARAFLRGKPSGTVIVANEKDLPPLAKGTGVESFDPNERKILPKDFRKVGPGVFKVLLPDIPPLSKK
jgi:hypothetical protein